MYKVIDRAMPCERAFVRAVRYPLGPKKDDLVKIQVQTVDSESTVWIDPHRHLQSGLTGNTPTANYFYGSGPSRVWVAVLAA